MKFPKYNYDDMVLANQATNGTSRSPSFSDGNIYGWNAYLVWGYTYPNFMDALMP
jgi:homoserine O-acetyltransferase